MVGDRWEVLEKADGSAEGSDLDAYEGQVGRGCWRDGRMEWIEQRLGKKVLLTY